MTQDPAPSPAEPPSPKRRRLRRIALAVGVLFVLLVGLVLAAPLVLSTGWARGRIAHGLEARLGAPVELAGLSFGWFSGLSVEGLVIGNPPGFEHLEEPAIRLPSLEGDVSLLRLLTGRVDLEGTVRGLEVRVHQKEDGTSNLQALFRPVERAGEVPPEQRQPQPPSEPRKRLDGLRLDLQLTGGRVDVTHEVHGLLESMQDIEAVVDKPFGTSDVMLVLEMRLRRPDVEAEGRVTFAADVDAGMQRPLELKFDVDGIDLARYRPVLAVFVQPGRVTDFDGLVAGSGRAFVDAKARSVELTGELVVEGPRFAGEAFGGVTVAQPRWTLQPNLRVALAEDETPPVIEAERLHVDLGFLKVDGMPAAVARELNGDRPSLGLEFTADLGALGEMGGPLARLRGTSGTMQGRTALAVVPATFEPQELKERIARLLSADIEAKLDRFELEGQAVQDLSADLELRDGTARLSTDATVGGGPFTLAARLDAAQRDVLPAALQLEWREGRVHGRAVQALRYVVPVLAGLEGGPDVQFRSGIRCNLDLEGPLLPGTFDGIVAWLDEWTGSGEVKLVDGAFVPAGALGQLFALTGESGQVTFEDVRTDFEVRDGFVQTGLLELTEKARAIAMAGRTELATGKIEYEIDLGTMLAEHRDGRRVLEALGGEVPAAVLGGTVQEPTLEMPDVLGGLLEGGGLKEAAESALQRGIERGLGEIFGGRKKKE